MAQLDPLLSALVARQAQELVMSEGRPAALRLEGKLRPVSHKPLDRAHIQRLLAELSDVVDAAAGTTTPVRFRYEMRPGQCFECQVLEANGQLTARVTPATAGAPQPQPTRPSQQQPHQQERPQPAAVPVAERAPAPDAAPEPTLPAAAEFMPAADPPDAGVGLSAPPSEESETVDMGSGEPDRAPEPFVPSAPAPPRTPPPPVARAQFEVDKSSTDSADEPPSGHPPVAAAAPVAPAAAVPDATQPPPRPRRVTGSSDAIDRLLRHMVELEASDLHLSSDETPMLRLHGEMCRVEGASPIAADAMVDLLAPIIPDHNWYELEASNDTDFAYEISGVARFRVNLFADRKGRGAVFRMIPSDILTAEQLGLPEAVLRMCDLSKGLVLVTGPTGSGKSTTLAAMIDHINRTRSDHIITIEDPVEFVHPNHKCLVNQREVITHTKSFKRALRAALREDPDIVLVGELRDLETIEIAIETAETGHLVFGTLHTTTAISTVDRIIDQFPADRQAQIRTMLSESLKGVVAQTLLKKNGGGRVAALEVLIVTPAISNLIRESKTFQIASLMQTGRKLGMRQLNDALIELVKGKQVEPDEALRKAVDKSTFSGLLKGAGIQLEPIDVG